MIASPSGPFEELHNANGPALDLCLACKSSKLGKQVPSIFLQVLSSRLNVGHFPHLADLVIRINYNHYYMNEHGRIFSPPAAASTHHL
jgi:hypothetical protein